MSRSVRFWLFTAVTLFVTSTGCASATDDGPDDTASAEEAASRTRRRPVDGVDPFPRDHAIRDALDLYGRDKGAARAESPISVAEFFGEARPSANEGALRVERLRPTREHTGRPIAFLSAQFHGSDMYWNNRYKDVQVERVLNWSGYGLKTVAPEAQHYPSEGRALIRIWNEYRPFSKGAPDGFGGDALRGEIARALIASYVAGNVDGPASNANNGGLAKVMLASGRSVWRGVIIDCGACWHTPSDQHLPWKAVVMGAGVTKSQVPDDVFPALKKIAESTRQQLLDGSGLGRGPESIEVVEGQRQRAQRILAHYEIPFTPQ